MKICHFLSTALLSAFAFPAHAFTLADAWQAALNHSAEFSAARHNRNAEAEKKHQARAALLPQITLGANYHGQPSSASSERSTSGWDIQVSQVLFDKSRFAQYRQGKLAEEMADIRLQRSGAELRMKVAQAYFDVLLQQDRLTALQSEKAAYAKQIEQAREMFQAGAATVLDTYEAQAGYDAALAKEIETHTALQTAQNTLADLTGLNPEHITPVSSGSLPDLPDTSNERQWQELARRYNPDWQLQRKETENAQEALQAEKGGRFPALTADGSYRDNRHTHRNRNGWEEKQHNKGSSFHIRLSMPLFSGGRISSRIREAAAREMQNKALLAAAERNTRLAVRQAYALTQSGKIRIAAQQKLLETNRAKLEATRLGREVGIRNSLEEIQAQQSVADTEQKLAEAKYAYIKAYLQLLHSAGVLGNRHKTDRISSSVFAAMP